MPKLLLLLSFLYTLAIMWRMSGLRKLLVIPEKKINALLSLELNWGKDRVQEVVTTWKTMDLLPTAEKMNNVDFLFIIGYIGFLLLGVIVLKNYKAPFFVRHFRLLISICLLLAVIDLAEGIASIFWLKEEIDGISPMLISLLATIKFLLVVPLLLLVIVNLVKRLVFQKSAAKK
jgi:hypothetical protein